MDEETIKYFNNMPQKCPEEEDNDNFKNGSLSIIVGTNAKAAAVNSEKLDELLPLKKGYSIYSSTAKDTSSSTDAPTVRDSVPYTTTGQLPTILHLKKGAPIIITSNSKKKLYKEDGICNGARGYVFDITTENNKKDDISIVWVKFLDESVGKIMKYELARKNPKYRHSDPLAIPIIRESTSFKYKGYYYRRSQFPLVLCYAITTHKSQAGANICTEIIFFDAS